mmetsp:Transcript_2767/g.2404  ORF Transcript_2767/g.2404 Transcript_2767/m.2404 type:complete len:139 (+) Transcript_2767:1506-1922(+)
MHEIEREMRGKKGHLVIKINDTGCGMSKSSVKSIFGRGTQVGSDRQKRAQGFGIGLWYTKVLIEHMGGSIKVDSHVGVGTQTVVRIPCTVPSIPHSFRRLMTKTTSDVRRTSLAVVIDDPLTHLLIQRSVGHLNLELV